MIGATDRRTQRGLFRNQDHAAMAADVLEYLDLAVFVLHLLLELLLVASQRLQLFLSIFRGVRFHQRHASLRAKRRPKWSNRLTLRHTGDSSRARASTGRRVRLTSSTVAWQSIERGVGVGADTHVPVVAALGAAARLHARPTLLTKPCRTVGCMTRRRRHAWSRVIRSSTGGMAADVISVRRAFLTRALTGAGVGQIASYLRQLRRQQAVFLGRGCT